MPYRNHAAIVRRLRELVEDADRLGLTAKQLIERFSNVPDPSAVPPPVIRPAMARHAPAHKRRAAKGRDKVR